METYTLRDIARLLDKPESTVRNWRNRYADFIPYEGEGRARRYPEQARKAFAIIAQGLAIGQEFGDIAQQLSTDIGRFVELQPSDSNDHHHNAIAQHQPITALEQIGGSLEMLTRQLSDNKRLQGQIERLQGEIDQLKERVQLLEDKQSFWQRWRRKTQD